MRSIHLGNRCDHLALTAGYLPDHYPRNVRERSPVDGNLAQYEFESPDQYLAWRLTATAQQNIAFHLPNPLPFDLQTWLLGPSKDGTIQQLFDVDSNPERYHIAVHRMPYDPFAIVTPENLWENAAIACYDPPDMTHTRVPHRWMTNLLEAVLFAYVIDRTTVDDFMDALGHPYRFSRGFADLERRPVLP